MTRSWIGGERVEATSAAGTLEVVNPATLDSLGAVPLCGPADMERAVRLAGSARRGWAELEPSARASLLAQIGERIAERAEALARRSSEETGTPWVESLDALASVLRLFRQAAQRVSPRGAGRVVALLPAPEFPLPDLAARLASALAAGDVVIARPPPTAPLASLELGALLAPLPPGAVALISCDAATAAQLLDHVDAISGPACLAQSPRQVLVVPRDADLELAAAGVAAYRLFNGGQRRGICPTVYVEAPLAGAFVDRLHEYLAFLEIGNPVKAVTDLGPLLSAATARTVEDQVAQALKRGGKLVLGARRFQPWGLMGHFFQPTLFTRARPEVADLEEEILGPVLAVTPIARLEPWLSQLGAAGAELIVMGGDPERLAALGAVPRALHGDGGAAEPHPLLERLTAELRPEAIFAPAGTSRLAYVRAREPWWFPYAGRAPRRAGEAHR